MTATEDLGYPKDEARPLLGGEFCLQRDGYDDRMVIYVVRTEYSVVIRLAACCLPR